MDSHSEATSKLRKIIQQSSMELKRERKPVSFSCQELIKYCESHKKIDVLVFGFKSQKQNPYREAPFCSFL